MIYLDNAATTQMFEGGAEVYKNYACLNFFNPSAGYKKAIDIAKEMADVKQLLLNKLGASKGDIVFTGGATESNNLAIMGSKRNGSYEYIFSEGEHPSDYNVAKELERLGHVVHYVKLGKNGQVDYKELESYLNSKTRLISIEHVNNETGAINDIRYISLLRDKLAKNALLHVDGVQAFCKIPFSLDKLNVDFYSISAHKFHGPKGVGALYVKNINTVKSIVFGGGQENGLRSGTENVGGIMAMAYAIQNINIAEAYNKVEKLNKIMREILLSDKNVYVEEVNGSPYIMAVRFDGVNGETLMRALQDEDIIVSTGSACSSKKAGNRTLESMSIEKQKIKSYLRISFNEMLAEEEVVSAGKVILRVYNEIREKVL